MAGGGRSRAAARAAPARGRAPPHAPARATAPAARRLDLSRWPLTRALAAHEDRTAAGLFALLIFAYLWPALIGWKILSPISLVYEVPPWQHYRPDDIGSYYNGLLSDVPFADYPWRAFARGLIRSGTLPAWNPHVFAGIPFFSNPQTGIFSPFSLPLWILPLNYAIGLGAALKLWFGGFGTYLLVRQLRLGFLPGLLAGTSFAFCSMNIVWLTHETLPAVAVLLPWMLWLIERIFERGRLSSALWLAVAAAAALGGGHPGMQVHAMALAGLYALVRAALLRDAALVQRLRPLAIAGGGLVLGGLLMAVMLIPEALSSHGTLGTVARQGGRGSLPGSVMPLSVSRTLLFPDWWGRPSGVESSHRLITDVAKGVSVELNYNERTFYAGVVALLLAAIGLASREGWRRKAPFAVLAFIGLAIPLHAPGLYWIVEHLPAFDLVQNQRLHVAFELGAAVLAAFGLQAVLERPAGDRRRFAIAGGAILIGLVAFATIGPSAGNLGHLAHHFLTGNDFHVDEVLKLTSVAWFLGLMVAAGALLVAVRRWPQQRMALAGAIVLLGVFDMLHFAHGYQPMGPAAKVIPPATPAVEYLQQHVGDGRVVGIGYSLTNDWSSMYGLNDVRGYDPPQPTERLFRLWREANPTQVEWQSFTIEAISPAVAHVMSVMGARLVLSGPGVADLSARDQARLGVHRVFAGEEATIFANERAAPRVMVAPAVELTAGEDATRAALVAPGFDPRRSVVVEGDQPGVAGLAGGGAAGGGAAGARGSVAVAHEKNASVTLRATLVRRGLVVLNDGFTDGWTVRVDGKRAQALHVNDVMRGVVVGAGSHEVVWSYAVPGLGAGALVSGLALLVLLGAAGAMVVRGRSGGRSGGRAGDRRLAGS